MIQVRDQMKKVLITGANSYIVTSVEKYLQSFVEEYSVDTVDMTDSSWREKDFYGYDAVFHVAGIAHRKETEKNAELYYKVNRDLAADCAAKAKSDGVKQFVFLSSMSVYGLNSGYIDSDTLPNPQTNYGKSKLPAESALMKSESADFAVAVLRPDVYKRQLLTRLRFGGTGYTARRYCAGSLRHRSKIQRTMQIRSLRLWLRTFFSISFHVPILSLLTYIFHRLCL